MAQLILAATAQAGAPERVTNATNEARPLKKAGPPHDPNTMGIVTGGPTEFATVNEITTLIAAHQVTGPHGEVALHVAPMVGDGGLQNIRDVLTMAEADMTIVPLALLNLARGVPGLGDIRKRIVYIAPLYVEEFHIRAPWPIQDISDLAGKTVNLGVKNSAAAVLGGEIFERLGLKVNVVNLDQSAATSALRTGEIRLSHGYAHHTNGDYPYLVGQKSVSTIGARTVLIAYNWPKGSDRYRLLDFFVRSLFSRFSELKAGPHHPKWREVNLAATLPGWSQFPLAQRWFDQQEFDSFLSKRGIGAEADRAHLLHDFLGWREHSGGG